MNLKTDRIAPITFIKKIAIANGLYPNVIPLKVKGMQREKTIPQNKENHFEFKIRINKSCKSIFLKLKKIELFINIMGEGSVKYSGDE